MIFANPLPGPHIGEPGHLEGQRGHNIPALPGHRLPNGRWCFRVTQTFQSTTGYYKGQPHGALDFGNHNCGDAVLAPAAGTARRLVDGAGALMVQIDHGNGWVSLLVHLNGWTIPADRWVTVAAGQQVGIVGKTGVGTGCHLHWEVRYSGVKRDPWPLLAQNAEAQVQLQGRFVQHVVNRRATLRVNTNFREGPSIAATVLETFRAGTLLYPIVEVQGAQVGGSDRWFGCLLWAKGNYHFGYFHSSGLGPLEPVQADGITEDEVASRVRAAQTVLATEATRIAADATNRIRSLIP